MKSTDLPGILAWARGIVPLGSRLRADSRLVAPGDLFAACPGIAHDGRSYIADAVSRGAAAVLCEREGFERFSLPGGVPFLPVDGLAGLIGALASAWCGEPSREMMGYAVTGTCGKTTTSTWVADLLTRLGTPCGVIGTIGSFFSGKSYGGEHLTTPGPAVLQETLGEIRDDGARAFSMEASSIGLLQGRLDGTLVRHAIFTNLSRDHLDYHGTMEAYEDAKALLFRREGLESAVVNIDDAAGPRMCREALSSGAAVVAATSRGGEASRGCELIEATRVDIGGAGVSFDLRWRGEERRVESRVLGLFNVDNMLGAMGAVLSAGAGIDDVVRAAGRLAPPAGRLEVVSSPGFPMGVVDYSHKPDAVENALKTLRPIALARGGKLCIVIGAGGNRDAGKRPIMGAVADRLADRVIVTSDNPRFEDPEAIASEVASGVRSPVVIIDRKEAIITAFSEASPGDVVLVAGKGHEDYQEVRGVRGHFSDVETVRSALHALGAEF